jgi:hypothetical protein
LFICLIRAEGIELWHSAALLVRKAFVWSLCIILSKMFLFWGPSVGKKTPNSSPFAVLGRFFITSSIREKHKGFGAEGPKNIFPKLVVEKRLKYFERRSNHRSVSVDSLAVRLLPLQHYISRQVGEELPQHSLSLHCCDVKIFNQNRSFLDCAFQTRSSSFEVSFVLRNHNSWNGTS